MFGSVRELDMDAGDWREEWDSPFLGSVSSLVRTSKGIEIVLTEGEIRGDSEEFRREHGQELERMQTLIRRQRKRR